MIILSVFKNTELQTRKATKLQMRFLTFGDQNRNPPQTLHTNFTLFHCGTVTLWIICQKEEHLQPHYFKRIMDDKAFFDRL